MASMVVVADAMVVEQLEQLPYHLSEEDLIALCCLSSDL